jgi:hypothetical protein
LQLLLCVLDTIKPHQNNGPANGSFKLMSSSMKWYPNSVDLIYSYTQTGDERGKIEGQTKAQSQGDLTNISISDPEENG